MVYIKDMSHIFPLKLTLFSPITLVPRAVNQSIFMIFFIYEREITVAL